MRRFGIYHQTRPLRRALVVGLLVLLPVALHAFEVRVRVVDRSTQRGVADAQIIVRETLERTTTDARGEATLEVPEAGFYTVRAVTPSGDLVQPRLQVRAPGQVLEIFVGEAQESAGVADAESGIVVQGERERTSVSRYGVRLDEVKRIPGQFGEALRGIESLPGISAPPFGNGDIAIRGANPNANTYLLDDLPLGYAFHFFPVNSVLHNDLIRSIDVYTGAYPANFGNATGGVIAIESIDDVKDFGGRTSFAVWSANALFHGIFPIGGPRTVATLDETGEAEGDGSVSNGEGEDGEPGELSARDLPAQDDGIDGYWIAAGRASYMHKTLAQFAPEGVQLPVYWDAQIKGRYELTNTQQLYIYALGAKDTFNADIPEPVGYDPTKEIDPTFLGASLALDQAFHTEAVRHMWQPGSLFSNRLTVLYHENILSFDGEVGALEIDQELTNGYAAIRDDMYWQVVPDHVRVEIGGEARAFIYRNEGLAARFLDSDNDDSVDFFEEDEFDETIANDNQRTQYYNGYGMLTLAAWGFEFQPGFRVDHFGLTKQTVVDPRGTLTYEFPTKTKIFGGAGVYHRLPDPWQYSPSSGNPNLGMERAEHYGGGIEQEWESWLFKVEVFRHYYTDIVVSDRYITTPVKDNEDPYTRYEQPYLYNQRLGFSNDGTGFSEGYEIYIKRSKDPEANGWYGWVSFTWSRAYRNDHQHIVTDEERAIRLTADEQRIVNQYDNTEDLLADFDRTYVVSVIFGYKLNREWQFGARWRYQTSAPYTPIVGDDGGQQENLGREIFSPEFSEFKNSERFPPYHQLDIRVDRFFHYGWGYGNLFVELLNVYVRRNQVGENFDSARPYSNTNPAPSYDFQLLQVPGGDRDYWIPLLNIGIEMKF